MTTFSVEFQVRETYQFSVNPEDYGLGPDATADDVWDFFEANPYDLETRNWVDSDLGTADLIGVEPEED